MTGRWTEALPWIVLSAVLWALVRAAGVPLSIALPEIAGGAFGDARACAATLRAFAPLALCGLGVAWAFRAGLWNIGAEGQFIVGAIGGFLGARISGHWAPALAAGTLAGALYAAVPAWLRTVRGVPEILGTLMLNFVAIEACEWLAIGPWQESTGRFPRTEPIAVSAHLPTWLWTPTSGPHLGVLLAVGAGGASALAMTRTRFGWIVRALGANARAVQAGGFASARWSGAAFVLSGSLAGLAGATDLTAVSRGLDFATDQGLGYTAIAVALLARLHPIGVLLSAMAFAALSTGCDALQWSRSLSGLDRFAQVVQAVALFAILLHISRRRRENPRG